MFIIDSFLVILRKCRSCARGNALKTCTKTIIKYIFKLNKNNTSTVHFSLKIPELPLKNNI